MQLPGNVHCSNSADTVPNHQSQEVKYSTHFINSQEPPEVPPHCLSLEVGTLIMLLHNLDPSGLYNGTKLPVY